MSAYERIKEEVQDAKRSKQKRKARPHPPARFSWEERSKVQKSRLWRYYRDRAISRKNAQKRTEEVTNART